MGLFEEHGIHPRTDRGQNFLIDLNIVEFLAAAGQIDQNDVVLEIGAGTGGMTTFLAQSAAAVVSVEVDRNMYAMAQQSVQGFENVTLLNCDALKNKNQLSPQVLEVVQQKLDEAAGRRLKLVANLPYNIATPVVSNLVATDLPWARIVVTIQWELGLRMVAKPRSDHYGSLSVWLQSQCAVKVLKRMRPNVFWPRPQVDSAIVRLSPRQVARDQIHDRRFFHDFLRRLFHQRRKYLRSVVVGMYRRQLSKVTIDGILGEMGLAMDARAEQLSSVVLVDLSNRLHQELQRQAESETQIGQ
jgi:16S rRNA (adenine1518-N6/adenine1519-N6)-dimethyltransferase